MPKLKKKTVKTRKNTKTSKKKMYFGVDTHDAIVKFQGTEDKKEKEKIYEKEIRKAFNKLAENLIFIHGFASDANSLQKTF